MTWPMKIYFVTGNEGKAREVKAVLGDGLVERVALDLDELQSLDSKEIVRSKLDQAVRMGYSPCIVEDTSLRVHAWNGFPGPLIKWMLGSLGSEGLARLVARADSPAVTASCVLGYARGQGDGVIKEYFVGELEGRIVRPRGESRFGWDPIFEPLGHDRTFGQMSSAQKNAISHRRRALDKLRGYLDAVKD